MSASEEAGAEGSDPKPAAPSVVRQNAAVFDALPFADFEDARCGFLVISIAGEPGKLLALFSRLDTFARIFKIDEPLRKTVT